MNTCDKCEYFYEPTKKCLCTHPAETETNCEWIIRTKPDKESARYNAKNPIKKQDFCIFNKGIQCYPNERLVLNCYKCAWNPCGKRRTK